VQHGRYLQVLLSKQYLSPASAPGPCPCGGREVERQGQCFLLLFEAHTGHVCSHVGSHLVAT